MISVVAPNPCGFSMNKRPGRFADSARCTLPSRAASYLNECSAPCRERHGWLS